MTDTKTRPRDEELAALAHERIASDETVSVVGEAGEPRAIAAPLEGEDLPSGTRIGRYSVISRLGGGGMGVVYEARDPQLDRLVALKVLREGRASDHRSPADNVLLAEAQTLAKIGHPNIVAVYDAGVSEGRVFITMELCRGQNLRQWLARGRHGVREILDVFIEAGRGLAAAHAAGVVHRDFKPANVLMGEGGTVQVADFGMARLAALAIDLDDYDTSAADHDRSASTIVGTPTYMAPEQLQGRVGDHRMDQFSFCLCLYWALIGDPPFPGRTFQERRRSVPLGLGTAERELLHRARSVPVRVRRALLRGLAVDPGDRFASMDALLAELVERRRRWPLLLSSLALAVAVGVGALETLDQPNAPCEGVPAVLAEAWGAGQRAALAETLARSKLPDAVEQGQRVERAFDGYAAEWKKAYVDACEATYVTRLQSDAVFDLRMRCLERRRVQLEIAARTMAEAGDAKELEQRMALPFRLPAIAECSDVDGLESVAPPTDPETRARIDGLLRRIDEANALREAGKLEDGLVLAREAVAEARSVGHRPALAQALECLGRLQTDGESPQAAEHTLREAIQVGSLGHDERLVARAWPSLLFALVMQSKVAAAESLGFAAEVAVDRAGDELARGWLFNNLGILHSELGNHDQARDFLQRALSVKSRLRGARDFDVGITWSNLGFVLVNADRWSEARAAFEQAETILANTVGATHPLSEVARTGQCRVAVNGKDFGIALELCTAALSHFETAPTSPALVSRVRVYTAKALQGLGRTDEALAMARDARALVVGLDEHKVKEIDAWIRSVAPEPAALTQ